MPEAALIIWIVTLLVIALLIVPVAVALLRRVLSAARAIEIYLSDMHAAGTGIAQHAAAIPALDQTLDTAGAMVPIAQGIEAKTGAVAQMLTMRADEGNKR